ncbi:MAG TPA: hypothetical protein PLI68_10965 [Bacteroidia bacterium]|nr:hypothetical protein [Bacteroidia bacterium]HRH07366.1 hypothetical protein [Bacteroidia bacterium]HRH63837.1 hypothetical protein [Bacteroidia bacterium]
MKNTNCLVLLTFFCLFSAPACKKYEDGPILSLRTKKARLVGDWKIVKTTANGVELNGPVTDLKIYADGSFNFEFAEHFIGVKKGNWAFSSNKEKLDLSDSCCTDRYKILKLKNKELWLKNSFQISPINSLEYEYHFQQY